MPGQKKPLLQHCSTADPPYCVTVDCSHPPSKMVHCINANHISCLRSVMMHFLFTPSPYNLTLFAPHSADSCHIKHGVCRCAMCEFQVCSSSSCMKNVTRPLHMPQPYMLTCIAFLTGCKEHAQTTLRVLSCTEHACMAFRLACAASKMCMHPQHVLISVTLENDSALCLLIASIHSIPECALHVLMCLCSCVPVTGAHACP